MKIILISLILITLFSCTTTEENKVEPQTVIEEKPQVTTEVITEKPQPVKEKPFTPITENLDGKYIKVVTHIEDMVEIISKLENDYPSVNWIPAEYVHSSFYLSPNSRDTYGNYLILETTGEKTNLIPQLFYMGDQYKDGYYRIDKLRDSEDINRKIMYFQDSSVVNMLERLPEIVDLLNSKIVKHKALVQFPFDEKFPNTTAPFLHITDNEVLTIDRTTGVDKSLFNYTLDGSISNGIYSWDFNASAIPSNVKTFALTLFHIDDLEQGRGRYRTALGEVENGVISLSGSFRASWVKGTAIKSIQLLLDDNTLLSYPYDLLPRIKEYDEDYFDTFSKYIYWNHYDPTAD